MILYVNGDSHSRGGLTVHSNQSFATRVAKEFGLDIVNEAQSGASNARILRTSKEYFATQQSPTLVIIGWSTWEREEWQHENQYYNVNSSGHDPLPKALTDYYKKWVIDQTPDHLDAKSRQIHEEIYDLHLWLKQQRIPHLFFNCMYNFFGIQQDQKKDWNNCYIDPYDNDSSFYSYLTRCGFNSDDWYHFRNDAQRAWGDRLISYIKAHKLL
jgi:hypothetical protein